MKIGSPGMFFSLVVCLALALLPALPPAALAPLSRPAPVVALTMPSLRLGETISSLVARLARNDSPAPSGPVAAPPAPADAALPRYPSAFHPAAGGTPDAFEISPALSQPTDPACPLPCVYNTVNITFDYAGGPATLSGSPAAPTPWAKDDSIRITFLESGQVIKRVSMTLDQPAEDISSYLQPGANHLKVESLDEMGPERGGGTVWLVVGEDTIPPVISDVVARQDGAGRTIVMATITDNVAVAAASVWWNGVEYPMALMGPDRYYAIINREPNGIVGKFNITAVDPSGNLACWPAGCGTASERIRYLIWAGLKTNTAQAGEPVNTATGNFYTQHQDVYAPAPGAPFEFKRTYNSLAAAIAGPLGYGWTHNFNTRLQVVDDPLLRGVVVTYADGHVANFTASGGGYTAPPGDNNTLAANGSGFVLTMPERTKYFYDAAGKLTRLEDRNGNAARLSYTGNDLTQMIDAAGRVYTFEYAGGRIVRISDALGRAYRYSYDGEGNLEAYTDPTGGVLRYTYNSERWLLSITDPNGHTFVTNVYDDRGRVVTQTDAAGSVSTFQYVDERRVVFTDNEGKPTKYAYDDELRLIETTDAAGYSEKRSYDADNNPISVIDKGGHETKSAFDGEGNLLSRQDALGGAATYTYDADNNLTYQRDPAGAETTYAYDGRGNRTGVHDAEGGQTAMTYDGRGLLLTVTDPNGNLTEHAYDAQGNRTQTRDALGNITRYEYDAMGRQTAVIDGNGHIARFEYSPDDRLVKTVDAKGNATLFSYDPVGNLLSVIDRRGYKTSYTYDVNDSLTQVTDARGNTTAYTYDRMYHRLSVTNRRGYTTSYTLDAVYNVVATTDARGNTTRFSYDPDGNLLTTIDANGVLAAAYEWDALHRVTKLTTPVGYAEYKYDPTGRMTEARDPKGGITRLEYDRLGRVLKVTDALLNPTTYTYDPAGNRLAMTNALGYTTHYAYDMAGRLTRETDPLGHPVAFSHDAVGNLILRTDARGSTTRFVYDENDNLIQQIDALGGVSAFAYDEENNRTAATDARGNTTTTVYGPLANPLRVTLPLGQATGYAYDEDGNVVSITNAKGKVTALAYDEVDLLTRRTDPLGNATVYNYDALGQLVRVTDAENNSTTYGYDAAGRLTQVVDALGGRAQYEYDPLGNLTAFVDANAHRTEFSVDLLGRRTQETDPLGKVWKYRFDAVGNLVERTDANGAVTRYTFNADSLLINTAYPTGGGVSFWRNENHELTGLTDGSGRTSFAYDALGRITQVDRNSGILAGKTLKYAYDAASNRTAITYPDGKVLDYQYDANNWLSRVIDPVAGATTYAYDPVGLPVRVTNANGTWTDNTYDDADRLVSIFNGKPATSTNVISSFEYTLDRVGNRVRSVERVTRGQVITWTEDYTYDRLYRLTKAIETPDYNPAQPYVSQFVYDAVGNRLAQTTNIQDAPNTPPLPQPVTTAYTYNAANQMLSAGATKFRYDNNGNRVSLSGPARAIDYTYDYENRVSKASAFKVLSNGKRVSDATLDFTYDGLGRRLERGISEKGVRKTAGFLYDGQGYDLTAQYLSHGNPRTTYYFRDLTRMLARYEYSDTEPGQWYSFHYDGLGSVSAWSNRTGGAVQEYKYAPYGRLIDNNGPDNSSNATSPHNSVTFSGKLWDAETETYYFGARDYDPANGVWLTQDAYRGRQQEPVTLHRYQYARNNPVTWVDLNGFDGIGPQIYLPSYYSSSAATTIATQSIASSAARSRASMKSMFGGTLPAISLLEFSSPVAASSAQLVKSGSFWWSWPKPPIGFSIPVFRMPLPPLVKPGWTVDTWFLNTLAADLKSEDRVRLSPDNTVEVGGIQFNYETGTLGAESGMVGVRTDSTFTYRTGRIAAGGVVLEVSLESRVVPKPPLKVELNFSSNQHLQRVVPVIALGLVLMTVTVLAL